MAEKRTYRKRTNATDMRWTEPPPDRRGYGGSARLNDIAAVLRADPGRWALVYEGVASPSTGQALQVRGMERTVRRRSDGTWDVYARCPE